MDKPEANLLDLLAGVDVRALSRHLAVLAEQQGAPLAQEGSRQDSKEVEQRRGITHEELGSFKVRSS